MTELSFCQSTFYHFSQNGEKLNYIYENIEANQTHVQEANMVDDNKCKDDPTKNDDALKNPSNSIGLTTIIHDPRIRRFFTKIYGVVDIYCKRNRLSKRKLCSAIISEIY